MHKGVCEDQWLRKEERCRECKKEWRPDTIGDEDLTIEKRLNTRARATNDDEAGSENEEEEQVTQEQDGAEESEEEQDSREYQTSFAAKKRKRAVPPRRTSGRAGPRVIRDAPEDENEEMESE